jgi:hypothetical protein
MNQSLSRLVEKRVISRDQALSTSSLRDELNAILERGTPAGHPSAMGAPGVRRVPPGQPAGQGVGR